MRYDAIVIGVSAGGIKALPAVLSPLPRSFPVPLLIVQHRPLEADNYLERHLGKVCQIEIKEASDKEPLRPGVAFIAPAGYHLLVEADHVVALSVDPPVHHARPSIDVLFESAAEVFRNRLVGVLLTGAGYDGAHGLSIIRKYGGLTLVQDPETAEIGFLPQYAIESGQVDCILPLTRIAEHLIELTSEI
ncbi:MAG: chemotaxis protein CheB [Candidatus Ozemobacteraceae bacterium]